jgi:ubiquinone/menaquinone biosynthesis C-methylase UbiE
MTFTDFCFSLWALAINIVIKKVGFMKKQIVCPWWLGYFLIIPIRKLWHNPEKILATHLKEGMKVLDYGSAMGYFSIPLAKMVGSRGEVYCADIQKKMLDKLQDRANAAGVGNIIKPCLIGGGFNIEQLSGQIDFTVLFAVVHEVTDKMQLFDDLFKVSKKGAKLLFAEPKGHVKPEEFEKSLQMAKDAGFIVLEEEPALKGLCVLLLK